MNIKELKQKFTTLYGDDSNPIYVFFAPGRVNLIGEHTDYNGGFVFPSALSFGTFLLVRNVNKKSVSFASINFEYKAEIPLNKLSEKIGNKWINYPLGVINEFVLAGIEIKSMQMLFSGDIPNGAGLSSSASVEMVTAIAINDLYNLNYNTIDLIKLSQKAENRFVGVNCGIMDQFAVGMGKQDHALFLNCDTLEYELVPIILGDYSLVIANTNKKRGLADSKYNERRSECDKAVEFLQAYKPIKLLGELSKQEFESNKHLITDDTVQRRAKHVIYEIDRVVEAVKELKNNKLDVFGQLMNQSHDSLRDDYEVTGIELDTMVYESRKVDGVLGSRMTGAGFGGCTVSLVLNEKINEFCNKVSKNYMLKTGISPDFYIAQIGDGARKILQ